MMDHQTDAELRGLGVNTSIPGVSSPQPPAMPTTAAQAPAPPAAAPGLVKGLSPAPDERVLLELASHELDLLEELRTLERGLVRRVGDAMASPSTALDTAKVLRQVIAVDTSVARKAREALLAASTLRSRRHFIEGKGAAR